MGALLYRIYTPTVIETSENRLCEGDRILESTDSTSRLGDFVAGCGPRIILEHSGSRVVSGHSWEGFLGVNLLMCEA